MEGRARERNEAAVKKWVTDTLPVIKKLTETRGTLVLEDEAGFSPAPLMPNTWAVRGTSPRMRFNFDWKKLSAIGGITPSGELYFEVHEVSVRSEEVVLVQYLEQLLRQMDGHVVVLWDGLPRHRSAVVRDLPGSTVRGSPSSGFLPTVPTSTRWSSRWLWAGHKMEQDEGVLPEQSAGAEDEAEQRGRGAQEEARCPGILLRATRPARCLR
ncbi:MAG: transposase [Conexivisphaera sp.]